MDEIFFLNKRKILEKEKLTGTEVFRTFALKALLSTCHFVKQKQKIFSKIKGSTLCKTIRT
jgi:hypothetical protein